MDSNDAPLPLSFRADLLGRLLPSLRAGESCALVGVSGVGKSNLVRFLQRPDVQAHYWGDARVWLVAIDTNGLVFDELPPEYSLIELVIHRLIREAERRGLHSALIAEIDTLHTRLVDQPSLLLAVRYLERICGRICESQGVQLILMFDQFEDVWQRLDARLFVNLRHIRDELKYRLAYLVFTRERLQRSRADLDAVESFWELFGAHVFGLEMYSASDAQTMLERICHRRGVPLAPTLCDNTLALSGGHAGLMRAVFWSLLDGTCRAHPDDLAAAKPVAEECAKIWQDLPTEEREQLLALSTDQATPADDAVLRELRLKGLVAGDPLRLFAPVFAAFVRSHRQTPVADETGIVVRQKTREVLRDGRLLGAKLSPLEFKMLAYLARHAGGVCSRDAVLEEIYGEKHLKASDERLDTLVRRLREALGDNARAPRYLHTHRGVGYQLVQARLVE
ncbi:MAG TPA: winged helix-turn-helix domain-containing protein [Roseiflexaceae bacterium]|nr:winged helix-turn-helix domain-containing protein [Roseiflexaceae bacterium]